jgi:L-aminopeptidase/D-esterase-like protein
MPRILQKNALTDVSGIRVGHYTSLEAVCGCTVVICPAGATAGVDVRGSAPGTRETDLLAPSNLVEKVQAVVLSGGSVYGLSVCDGVVEWLSGQGWGFPLAENQVAPIVPAAALFDLGRGKDFIPPIQAAWGKAACESADEGPITIGTIGAGTGAMSGGIKGGLGTASEVINSGITVAALVAVNSLGTVIDPRTGRPWEQRLEKDDEFGPMGKIAIHLPDPPLPLPAGNTTIGVVATDALLTKAQAQKIAQMAHDGLARAIRPAHTMFDGDTIFCIATGAIDLPRQTGFFAAPQSQALNDIGRAAADCMTRAIIRGVLAATSLGGMTAFRNLPKK